MPKTTKRGTAKKSELPSTLAEVARQGAADLRQGARRGRRAVRRGRAGAPRRLRRAEAQLREGRRPLGAEGREGAVRHRARSGGPNPTGTSAEGVDANASKTHLMDVARRLDISGRSTMTKIQLVNAIKKANRRATDRNR